MGMMTSVELSFFKGKVFSAAQARFDIIDQVAVNRLQ